MLLYALIDFTRLSYKTFSLVIKQNLNYSIPFDREFHEFKNGMSESMGNVPLCTRPSQNLLKLSVFVELDELIISI
jgi:hypothetical protein